VASNFKKEKQPIFNKLRHQGNWSELEKNLLEWLTEYPDDHWLLAQLSDVFYLTKRFDKAVEYAEKAWKVAPHCPMVLWQYSEALYRVGRNDEAEPLYRNIIRRGVEQIAYGKCGEGLSAARTLVNDCYYPLGGIASDKGDFKSAEKYIKRHIKNRNRNSLFRLSDVKKDLALVQQRIKPTFDE
jgi:tetratricopeptide (TPR) repeat protein